MRPTARMCALALLATLLIPPSASAYTIASGFSTGCHERITLDAFDAFFLEQPTNGIPVGGGETWRELVLFFRDTFPELVGTEIDPQKLDEAQRFMLVSLLVGVRSPDTDGHSVLNLENLRLLHSDPSPEGQYAHALRGPADDATAGNAAVVEGTRRIIEALVLEAVDLENPLRESELIQLQGFYLDFYGIIQTEVYMPMYLLGRAAHALQDSFSHAIRDDSPESRAAGTEFRQIVHVLNYVEAIGADFEETRDGLAHSDSMDDCTGEPGEEGGTVDAASQATFDLFFAYRAMRKGLDAGALKAASDKWLTLREGCDATDGFCDNTHWLEVVREAQTQPYFDAIFGCSTARTAKPSGGAPLLWLALLMGWIFRQSRRPEPPRP
jgi:hypothetical protein